MDALLLLGSNWKNWNWVTRLKQLCGYVTFLPPTLLESDSSGSLKVYLCWRKEASSACPGSGRRG